MNRLAKFYASSIGKKFIAAITGLILFGFVAGHVAGNLKVFTGVDKITESGEEFSVPHIDQYGQFLKQAGEPFLPYMAGLWLARIVLLSAVILHIVVVIQLSLRSAEARPVEYVKSKKSAASWAARYMMFSGSVVLAFIIFHILHFTTGTIRIGEFQHGEIYANLRNSFQHWYVSLGYVVVMGMLAFHMFHGVWSLFQTLGLDSPDRNQAIRIFAMVASIGISIGFAVVPLAFLFGVLPEVPDYPHHLLGGH
jgi:succinate dehydrogenase / fumarate reductase cytochrome b subunit